MTDKENTEEIELDDAEDNPWYQFFLASIELDKGDDDGTGARGAKPHGWHWFWGIYGLHREISAFPQLDIDEIEKKLPDNECLRLKPHEQEEASFHGEILPTEMQKEATSALYNFLKESDSLETVREIDFSGVFFEDEVIFSNLIFPVRVSFKDSEFHNCVNFIGTCFFRSADFLCTKFFNLAYFSDIKFFSDVTFSNAVFSSCSNFDYTVFSNHANFLNTVFSYVAVFTGAKFLHSAIFSKAEFHNGVIFSDVTFSKGATFRNTIFSFRAIFDKVIITGHTDFKYAEFKDIPPSFRNVDMYSDIIWDEIKWPILNKESQRKTVKQNISTYEDLASYMKKLDKPQNEHIFYREYMRCRGWLEKQPMKFFYRLYEILADFGYGVEPAFRYWRWHMYAGAVIIAIISLTNSWLECWKDGALEATKSALCSIPLSFANAHSFLPFHKGALEGCYDYFMDSNFFNTIWVFQTLAGIILLFLVLLTLRIRFRLK